MLDLLSINNGTDKDFRQSLKKKASAYGFEEVFKGEGDKLRPFLRELGAKVHNVKGQFKGHVSNNNINLLY